MKGRSLRRFRFGNAIGRIVCKCAERLEVLNTNWSAMICTGGFLVRLRRVGKRAGTGMTRSVRSSRIEATWPAERLLPISRLLLQNSRRLRALSTPTGPIPLPQVLRVIGPPTGAPIATGRKWLEFDCKDARIRAIGRRRISIALERQRIKRTLRRSLPLEGLESSTDAGP